MTELSDHDGAQNEGSEDVMRGARALAPEVYDKTYEECSVYQRQILRTYAKRVIGALNGNPEGPTHPFSDFRASRRRQTE